MCVCVREKECVCVRERESKTNLTHIYVYTVCLDFLLCQHASISMYPEFCVCTVHR